MWQKIINFFRKLFGMTPTFDDVIFKKLPGLSGEFDGNTGVLATDDSGKMVVWQLDGTTIKYDTVTKKITVIGGGQSVTSKVKTYFQSGANIVEMPTGEWSELKPTGTVSVLWTKLTDADGNTLIVFCNPGSSNTQQSIYVSYIFATGYIKGSSIVFSNSATTDDAPSVAAIGTSTLVGVDAGGFAFSSLVAENTLLQAIFDFSLFSVGNGGSKHTYRLPAKDGTFALLSDITGGGGNGGDVSWEDISSANATINVTYNALRVNKILTVSQNTVISVTGMTDGQMGFLRVKNAGGHTVTLGGTIVGKAVTTVPTADFMAMFV